MERAPLRKPKLYFDTMAQPSHVTFDDGVEQRRNLPWMNYVEARWDHPEPELIKIEIGESVVFLRGHNLGPLFSAIEEHILLRVRAQPGLQKEREHECDTFVSEIRFTVKQKPETGGKRLEQGELF
jgi:hypothetical protein